MNLSSPNISPASTPTLHALSTAAGSTPREIRIGKNDQKPNYVDTGWRGWFGATFNFGLTGRAETAQKIRNEIAAAFGDLDPSCVTKFDQHFKSAWFGSGPIITDESLRSFVAAQKAEHAPERQKERAISNLATEFVNVPEHENFSDFLEKKIKPLTAKISLTPHEKEELRIGQLLLIETRNDYDSITKAYDTKFVNSRERGISDAKNAVKRSEPRNLEWLNKTIKDFVTRAEKIVEINTSSPEIPALKKNITDLLNELQGGQSFNKNAEAFVESLVEFSYKTENDDPEKIYQNPSTNLRNIEAALKKLKAAPNDPNAQEHQAARKNLINAFEQALVFSGRRSFCERSFLRTKEILQGLPEQSPDFTKNPTKEFTKVFINQLKSASAIY